jgi:opacity protein-like surface antigen
MKNKLLLILLITSTYNLMAQNKWLLGGQIGMSIPSNRGEKEFNIRFKDVASIGTTISASSKWFYAKTLSITTELSYSTFPRNKSFWDMGKYGNISAQYNIYALAINGDYYFTTKKIQPFIGISFGYYILSNKLDFKSSYTGTTADASVSYKKTIFKPGFSPEAGFLIPISKKNYLIFQYNFQIIPNIKPNTFYITDKYGNTQPITQNPHSNENHSRIITGLLFKL